MNAPAIKSVSIAAVQPEAADQRRLAYLQETSQRPVEPVVYVVKVELAEPLPVTSCGFELFVGEERIAKYSAFPGGVFFKVHNPDFLDEHRGQPIRLVGPEGEVAGLLGVAPRTVADARDPVLPLAERGAKQHLPTLKEALLR